MFEFEPCRCGKSSLRVLVPGTLYLQSLQPEVGWTIYNILLDFTGGMVW